MDPVPAPASPSYRLAAVDALSRGDADLYRLLMSKPGVGPNPIPPTAEELAAYLEAKNPSWGLNRSGLHICCGLGLREAVEVVMESEEVDVDCVDDDGETPLLRAVWSGHSDVIGLLVERYGADVNMAGGGAMGLLDDMSPLYVAALAGHTETVRKLLSVGADPDTSVLKMACREGPTAIVQALLSAGADPNSHSIASDGERRDDTSVLSWAVYGLSPSKVSLVLEYGADPRYRMSYFRGTPHDPTELHYAAFFDRPQCVRLLCDAGADVSASMTAWMGVPGIVGLPQHSVPLRMAAFRGYLGNVAVLLSCGADPFEVDEDEGVPIIDCPPHDPSMCVLMDSRPSCPWG